MIELKEIKAIPTLMRWREEVIRNVFGEKPDKRLLVANRQYYARHIANGTHLAFMATVDGEDAGCGAVCLTDELPSPDNPSGRCAYLMNIYVRETFRNHGVAHHIVSRLIEESVKQGCGKIYLETTADGKPVYTSLGFREMPDMMKYYDT
ncbi:MAG: GNAT family N-acetyltransferase [Muribaculaceae bacterium]|nr:GNAT family N-acetyltransferase [Muribaculaceae bacterium]